MEGNSPGVQIESAGSSSTIQTFRNYLRHLSWPGYYISEMLLIALILNRQLHLWKRYLRVPIDFSGDTVYFLTIIKAIAREGWWWHVNSIAAPEGLSLVSMPAFGNLDTGIIKLLSIFTQSPGLLLNVYWFATVVVAGVVSTWCMLRLGVEARLAFVLGILYALSPHIYYRHTAHLMLSHHLIPLIGTLAVLLASGRPEVVRGKLKYVLLAGCVLVGFSYMYYAFFSSFVLLAAALVALLRRTKHNAARFAVVAAGIVIISAALNLTPSIRAWITEPGGRIVLSFKSPPEADHYGLKIRNMITPTPKSPIPLFGSLNSKIQAAQFPLDQNNESVFSRMGSIASLGFLLLIVVSVFMISTPSTETVEMLKATGAVTMACVLLGTVGGFGSIFNVLVRPDIRAYNRIAIFITFFSLAAVGIVLTKVMSILTRTQWGSIAGTAFSLLILWVGVVDQNEASVLNSLKDRDEQKFVLQSDFVRKIEKNLPPGAMVYQLPHLPYGDGDRSTPLNPRVPASSHHEPFLFSDSVRWSWPAVSTEAQSFARRVGQLRGEALADTLRNRGFSGVYIDRLAYEDNAAQLIKDMANHLGRSPIESGDSRYAFFNLNRTGETAETDHYTWGDLIVFSPNGGNAAAYLGEGWSCVGCTEGTHSTMQFTITPATTDVTLKAHVTPAVFGGVAEREVRIAVNDVTLGAWHVRQPDWYSLSIPRASIEKKSRLIIRFDFPDAVSPKSLGINEDSRVLSVAFDSLQLSAK